jgi:hypothetical protein
MLRLYEEGCNTSEANSIPGYQAVCITTNMNQKNIDSESILRYYNILYSYSARKISTVVCIMQYTNSKLQ